MDKISTSLSKIIQMFEFFFAVIVLISVVASISSNVNTFLFVDWSNNKSFYDLIYRVLLLVIGLELARLLITHNLQAVLELIAFVIARKTLKPDVTSLDVLLIVIAFFLLICSRVLIMFDFKNFYTMHYGRSKEK
jgi:hypothetical protein